MNKAEILMCLVKEASYDAKVALPRKLSSQEIQDFFNSLASKLDPKEKTISGNKFKMSDGAYVIEFDNDKRVAVISGDITVQRDIKSALGDIDLEVQ